MNFLNTQGLVKQFKGLFGKPVNKQNNNSSISQKQAAKTESKLSDFSIKDSQQKINQIVKDRKQFINPSQALSYADNPLKISHARGQYMYQENGAKVLDCINNVSHIGHCHPYYVMQMSLQAQRLLTNNRFLYDEFMNTTHKLLKKFPKELSVVTFVNSGSEANDLALQMARIHSKRKGAICFDGAYHGITNSCTEVSPYKWSQHYTKPDHIKVAASPCFYRGPFKNSQDPVSDYTEYLKNLIDENSGAFICQFMQSCGGQVIPPKNFYQSIYKVLKQRGVVCIGDEVQTGFGRLGEAFWAFEYYGVTPDIVSIGKAMGNGFPVAAVVCTREVAQSFKARDMEFFSTFGGNPMAVTATSAVLDVIAWQKLQQNALQTGKHLTKRLREQILPNYSFVGEIRGIGLFQGIDIVKNKQSREQNGPLAKRIIMKMRQRHILISRDGMKANVLKIKPPIIFNKENVDTLIENLKQVMDELASE